MVLLDLALFLHLLHGYDWTYAGGRNRNLLGSPQTKDMMTNGIDSFLTVVGCR